MSESEGKTYSAILVRRLREGKTYEDFVQAWYPDEGFGFAEGWGPMTGQNLADEREIVTFALFKLAEGESMDAAMERIGAQEAVRHDRIDEVIEETTLRGLYEVRDEFDFSTDETVEQGRPDNAQR
jgi:hypothetical protein